MNKFHEMIKIADVHAGRIRMALNELAALFPLDQAKVTALTMQDLLLIELLTNRFAKLQDFLGAKLINTFLEENIENTQNLTMLDKINKLERLEIIESTELWKEIRDVRNHISHEYPDHPELTAKHLNQIFTLSPKLLNFFEEIKKRANTTS